MDEGKTSIFENLVMPSPNLLREGRCNQNDFRSSKGSVKFLARSHIDVFHALPGPLCTESAATVDERKCVSVSYFQLFGL
jgi:hypothetical protein